MRLVAFCCAGVLLVLSVGCTTAQAPTAPDNRPIDSLRAENTRLRDQNRALRDSVQFYDDLRSGQYHRDLRTLQDRLTRLTYEVRLLRNGGLTVTVLSADSVFASPGTAVSDTGRRHLKALAHQLQSTYPNRTVWVEGHADSAALGDTLQRHFDSNWELSAARATTVVRHLIEMTSLDRSQFVAVGYGATHPRASNETAGGRRRNRRVRIAVLPRPQQYTRPFETAW